MNFRTDLAVERHEILKNEQINGVEYECFEQNLAKITRITVKDKNAERAIGKPIGKYITIEVPSFSKHGDFYDECIEATAKELDNLLPREGSILVVGLGNTEITPDALGPKAVNMVLATRHISGELARSIGLENLRSVAGIAPGVLGKTGVETAEIVAGLVKTLHPSAVITIDALAARRLSRLGCTVQICDTGIAPGSGVGNTRAVINEQSLGVPVISMGVPTVVDALTLAFDLFDGEENTKKLSEINLSPKGKEMMITPREIDLVIARASKMLAMSINFALQPDISPEEMMTLV